MIKCRAIEKNGNHGSNAAMIPKMLPCLLLLSLNEKIRVAIWKARYVQRSQGKIWTYRLNMGTTSTISAIPVTYFNIVDINM